MQSGSCLETKIVTFTETALSFLSLVSCAWIYPHLHVSILLYGICVRLSTSIILNCTPMGYHVHTGDHYYNPHFCGCATLTGLYFTVLVSGLSVTRATKRFSCWLLSTDGGVTMYFHDFFPIFPNIFCAAIIDYTRFAHLFIEQIFFLIFLENISLPLLQDFPNST